MSSATQDLHQPAIRRRSPSASIVHGLIYAALRVVGISCSFDEVAAGRYRHETPHWPPITLANGVDAATCEVLEKYVASAEADGKMRYDHVDSKLRTLLAANTLAFALMGGFSLLGRPAFLVIALPLVASAVLGLRALGVHTFQTLSLTDAELSAAIGVLRAAVLRDRLSAASANACVIDFIVDCFRAAHRYFIAGLVMVPLVYLGAAFLPPRENPDVHVRVRGIEEAITAAIQRAPGPQGPPGPAGPAGVPGPTGAACSTPAAVPRPVVATESPR